MSCALLDKDQAFIVQDYGPGGIVAPVNLNLPYGLKPGAVISAVVTTDKDMELNVKDVHGNILLHVVPRVTKGQFGLNTFKDGVWGTEIKVSPIPVQRSCRFVLTLVYEKEGYRVFINSAEVAFFKHRFNTDAHLFEIGAGQTFKVVYLTTRDIVPM